MQLRAMLQGDGLISKAAAFGMFGLLCLVTAATVFFARLYPHLWLVFVAPGLSLLFFQVLALCRWAGKSRLFVFTDYLYYGLIGAAVVLASAYLGQGEIISFFRTQVEREQQKAELASARTRLRALQGNWPNGWGPPDQSTVDECIRPSVPMGGPGLGGEEAVRKLGRCGAVLTILREGEELYRLPDRIRHLESLEKEPVVPTPQPQRPLKVQFVWLPTVVLVGITLKLGKTTAALSRSRNPNEALT